MTFQEAKAQIVDRRKAFKSPLYDAGEVLLAEVESLQKRLAGFESAWAASAKKRDEHWLSEVEVLREVVGQFLAEIDDYDLVAYDDAGLSPKQVGLVNSARAVFDRTKL